MKIFYKKDFQRVLEEKNKLQEENDALWKKVRNKEFKYLDKYNIYKNKYEDLETLKQLADKENEDLKAQIKKVNGQKGILTRKINELTKRVEELEKKLEESMSDKYLVRKISSGRKPKGQSMKVKGSSKESAAIKLVKEKC